MDTDETNQQRSAARSADSIFMKKQKQEEKKKRKKNKTTDFCGFPKFTYFGNNMTAPSDNAWPGATLTSEKRRLP